MLAICSSNLITNINLTFTHPNMSFWDIVQTTKGISAFIHLVVFTLQGMLILMSEFPFSTSFFLSSSTSKPDTFLSQILFVIPTHSHNFHSTTSHFSDCVIGTITKATIPREVPAYEQVPHNQHIEFVTSTVRISSSTSKPNVELIYAFTSSHPPSTSIHPM